MFYGSLFNNKTTTNEEFKSRQRDAEFNSLYHDLEGISSNYDILDQIPMWIRDRYSSEDSFFVNFVQSYYDWLYSEYSGYLLDVGFQNLIDIDQIPLDLLSHYVYSYASDFPADMVGVSDRPACCDDGGCDDDVDNSLCYGVLEEDTREFIKNIRRNLYQKKTTEEAVRYFFRVLYNISGDEGDDVEIDYPKKYILRLNGGRFSGWVATGETYSRGYEYEDLGNLSGSRLNHSIIQDSDWYQNYSYLLSTPLGNNTDQLGNPLYKNVYENLIHPAGLKVIYERTIADYIPPQPDDTDVVVCENAILGNYYPYKMNDLSSIAGCSGCGTNGFGSVSGYDGYYSNWAYDSTISPIFYYISDPINGITYGGPTSGTESGTTSAWGSGDSDQAWLFTGITANPNQIPTHHYPFWTIDGITGNDGTQIGDIPIGQFFFLCPPVGITSPNHGITSCTESLSC